MSRESVLPLTVGLLLAIGLHLLMAPAGQAWLVHSGDPFTLNRSPDPTPAEDEPTPEEKKPTPRREPRFGRPDMPPSKVNLVTYEDYRELMARRSEVDQPAVQRQVEPDPEARRTPVDPTQSADAAPPTPLPPLEMTNLPTSEPAATDAERLERTEGLARETQVPSMPIVPDATEAPGIELPARPELDPTPDADELALAMPQTPSEMMELEKLEKRREATDAQPAADAPQEASETRIVEQSNPTVAPKAESEAEPVSRIASAEVQPGAVESVGPYELKTVRPRYGVLAGPSVIGLTRNPVYRLHFNAEGKVVDVTPLRTSGYEAIDAPLLIALHKWRLEGEVPATGVTLDRLEVIVIRRKSTP
jgi:hypothetical protein